MTQGEGGAKGLQLPETLSRLNRSFLFMLCILFLRVSVFATYSGPWVSVVNWFQDLPWIPKSTDAQVPYTAHGAHGSTSVDSTNQ